VDTLRAGSLCGQGHELSGREAVEAGPVRKAKTQLEGGSIVPTPDQLAHIEAAQGDGAVVVPDPDGSVQTSWPDGTVRIDETDGRIQVTFPDFSVLNIETDGTRTLNAADGSQLNATTGGAPDGQAADTPAAPATTVQELQELVEGVTSIAGLAQAEGVLKAFHIAGVVDREYGALAELASAFGEALKGELSPASWFIQPLKMLLEVIRALETEERGAAMRSWCYTVVYDAMGMGEPPQPRFEGSLKGADQDALDRDWWNDARGKAQEQLADGKEGVALRNRVLLLIAKCGGAPASAVSELWAASCRKSGDDGNAGLLASYPRLGWPEPTGA
jgi:hypothetical protein